MRERMVSIVSACACAVLAACASVTFDDLGVRHAAIFSFGLLGGLLWSWEWGEDADRVEKGSATRKDAGTFPKTGTVLKPPSSPTAPKDGGDIKDCPDCRGSGVKIDEDGRTSYCGRCVMPRGGDRE